MLRKWGSDEDYVIVGDIVRLCNLLVCKILLIILCFYLDIFSIIFKIYCILVIFVGLFDCLYVVFFVI